VTGASLAWSQLPSPLPILGPAARHSQPTSSQMRRSVRSRTPASHAARTSRTGSPSSSEITEAVATPSVSPTPEGPSRVYGTPGIREDGTPKRPMNAFILFSNEKRSELADLNPHLSNAAVSVLLGQRWREMHSSEKSGYVAAARRIKEDFHAAHPDARTRSIRKAKRKFDAGRVVARNLAPPSLHALALVGSRLNSSPAEDEQYDEEDEYDEYEEDEAMAPAAEPVYRPHSAGSLSLLEQLCTVAENEHNAAAHMLSAMAAH